MKYHTTLNKIRSFSPCESGWKKLLKGLGKAGPDDDTIPLSRILEINGLNDALWVLRAVDGIDKQARLYACECAQRVAHVNKDPRVQACIDIARRFANGEVSDGDMSAAWSAARSAAESAWSAAESAACSAAESAWSAAESAAWSAAESAAESAAWSAARSARGAARSAAESAERNSQAELYVRFFCTE